MPDIIKTVSCAEPMREGEYPWCFRVSGTFDHTKRVIARIEREEENLGTYGIAWFVGYDAEGRELGRINALHAAAVIKEPTHDDA